MQRPLTDEERARIARSKAEALKRAAARKARQAETAGVSKSVPVSSLSSSSYSTASSAQQTKQSTSLQGVKRPTSDTYNSFKGNNTRPSGQPILSSLAQNAPHPSLPVKSVFPKEPAIAPLFLATKTNVTVTFRVFTAERFKVHTYPYHASVTNTIKNLPYESRSYEERDKLWSVKFCEMRNLEDALMALKDVNVTIVNIAPEILKMFQSLKKETIPSNLFIMIDATLAKVLFPYQREGVAFALERKGRAIIADEMGLGKSLQAITIARYYRSEWPLVIVCPSSVKYAWKTQFNTFLPVISRISVIEKGSDPLPDVRTSNTVVIISYDQMVLKHKELARLAYQVLILDECHLLKDSKAKRTQVATDLAKIANRVIMLSGTPALSRPAELFSQVRIINPSLFPNYQQFAIRYCDGKQGRFCFEAKGCTNSEELAAILMHRVMIRRLKNDVLKDLPDKRREVIYLQGDSIDHRMDGLMKAKQAFEFNNNANPKDSHDSLLEYFSMTGIVKAAAVSSHVLDSLFYPDAPPRKVLIFAHHQIVLDTISVEVQKRNLKYIRIDGTTQSVRRGELCKSFQEDPTVMVGILSVTSAGVGITLTAATVVVFAELHWNPGTLLQAEDRAHRVGQKDSVYVQYLVARNTADDMIWDMIQRKLDVLGQVNLSSETFRDAERKHLAFDKFPKPDISDYFLEPKRKKTDEQDEDADDWK
ncbi:unnamed protein product [Auanema sp. JU1783]|nr:unnamed protein product [Auanema sp. JU1783]